MRILHLAFEDHARPGSGGGSLRNREINSRLAALGHEIDVVTANYPDARPRLEDRVHYRQRGMKRGNAPSLLSHQACLPRIVANATRLTQPDLIIEEFAPLTTSLGVGHWTGTPTIGIAQGFFAEQKARQYHLPRRLMTGIQAWGVRSHDHLIAVSEDVATQLRAVAPQVETTVVANGVDCEAAEAARARSLREDAMLLYLGRLEIDQKGLDVLIAAMEHVADGVALTIAGEGKDRSQIERDIRSRGLADRIRLVGATGGERKWDLLASASVLVQPSRYETFGISPLEAMASGTPVVVSDLACLRELIPTSAGVFVARENPRALAGAINDLISDPDRRRNMGAAGPERARRYSWDTIAQAQADVYADVLERQASWVSV